MIGLPPEVQAALIAGCAGIFAAALALIPWLAQRKKLREVHHQVKNSHGTNLRDDVDRVLQGISFLTEEVQNQRSDLAWEKRRRIDLDNRVDRVERRVGLR